MIVPVEVTVSALLPVLILPLVRINEPDTLSGDCKVRPALLFINKFATVLPPETDV